MNKKYEVITKICQYIEFLILNLILFRLRASDLNEEDPISKMTKNTDDIM